GHLVTINDAAEQNWINTTFNTSNDQIWIGLVDPNPVIDNADPATRAREFVWVSGEAVTYQNWAANEPNNPLVEHYVHLWGAGWPSAGNWNNEQDLATLSGYPAHGLVEVVDNTVAPIIRTSPLSQT